MRNNDLDPQFQGEPYSEAAQQAWAALQRYTGWLGHDRDSREVRAAVSALGVALDQHAGPESTAAAIAKVASGIERLEAVDLQPLLRKALQSLGVELGIPADPERG
jgi:hypothetical protein